MIKQFVILIGMILTANTALSISGEFPTNKAVEPLRSRAFSGEELRIQQYIPANHSEAELRNIVNRTVQTIGSSTDKKVYVVWTTDVTRKNAERIARALKNKQVSAKQITVVRSQYKRDIDPLYIEIHGFGSKKFNCRHDTAEDMMSFDPPDNCASKSNFRNQLKNPAIYQ